MEWWDRAEAVAAVVFVVCALFVEVLGFYLLWFRLRPWLNSQTNRLLPEPGDVSGMREYGAEIHSKQAVSGQEGR